MLASGARNTSIAYRASTAALSASRQKNVMLVLAFILALLLVVFATFVCINGFALGATSGSSMDADSASSGIFIESQSGAATTYTESVASSETLELLQTAATRDMSAPIAAVQAAEEEARIADENAKISQAQAAQARSYARGGVGVYEVDFSVGKDAFIAEWTGRIDSYLEGSVLEGYGSVFASAAWEYGVDPRFSPAISATESSKGAHCFASHNAWGWTGYSFGDWETAIYAHVQLLSRSYGFTISHRVARKYCPPNSDNWYTSTRSEINKI